MDLSTQFEQLKNNPIKAGKYRYGNPLTMAKIHWSGFLSPPHIQAINKKLMELVESVDGKNQAIFMPPRHGKSEFISKYFIAWYIINFPDKQVIFISRSFELASNFGSEVKNIVSELGGPVKLRQDQKAKHFFRIENHKGSFTAVGMGGQITGKGADLLVIDDPVKDPSEVTPEWREKTKEWYLSVVRTRMHPKSSAIIIQTRWHEDDLGGWLVNSKHDKWDVLSLPAINEKGEALWKERYPIEELRKLEAIEGPYRFNALYQQNPLPADGSLFLRDWLKYDSTRVVNMPNGTIEPGIVVIDWAIGGKKSSDSTVAIHMIPGQNGVMFVNDYVHGQWTHEQNLMHIDSFLRRIQPGTVYLEDNGMQRIYLDILRQAGYNAMGITSTGNKHNKIISAIQPVMNAGKLIFNETIHDQEFLERSLLGYPNTSHDDFCDALAMGIMKLGQYSSMSPFTSWQNQNNKIGNHRIAAGYSATSYGNNRRKRHPGQGWTGM